MARSIMDVMHENVNPTSVSNALYEIMLDWRSCMLMREMAGTKSAKQKLKLRRAMIEKDLSRFFCITPFEMRDLLEQHFAMKKADR